MHIFAATYFTESINNRIVYSIGMLLSRYKEKCFHLIFHPISSRQILSVHIINEYTILFLFSSIVPVKTEIKVAFVEANPEDTLKNHIFPTCTKKGKQNEQQKDANDRICSVDTKK